MITRVDIHNFRCFESLALTGLKRINVIVGESGSGKTAFLETLFLVASGSPDSYFRIRKWRGYGDGAIMLNGTRDSFEGMFRNIFHDRRKQYASISIIDSKFGKRSLSVAYGDKELLDVSLSAPENSFVIKPINFKYDVDGYVSNMAVAISEGKIKGDGRPASVFPMHYISSKNTSAAFDATLFSQVSRSMEIKRLVTEVRKVYDFIEELSLEIEGGETLIHASVTGRHEKIAVNELSGGINKFLTIAVAIASNRNGVVAIDEIENGFYFKDQEKAIRGLVTLCKSYDVQLIATTHSWEFLKAFTPAMQGQENEMCLIKSAYSGGVSTMRVVGGAASLSAISQDIEIRN